MSEFSPYVNDSELFECYFIDGMKKIKWNYNHITPSQLHGLFPEANGQVVIEKESQRGMITQNGVFQHGNTYIVPVPSEIGFNGLREQIWKVIKEIDLDIPGLTPDD